MKKNYTLRMTSMLALLLVSLLAFAQPDVDKTIIYVGQYVANTEDIRAEDSIAMDSIAQWVNVVFMDQGVFNEASAGDLYGESGTNAVGVVFSESIGSNGVFNFGLQDGYPVPAIVMEFAVFTSDLEATDKWPLLVEGGGIWGADPGQEVDLQWRIFDDLHYITEEYAVDQVVTMATPENSRGIPYLHGLEPYHIILATGAKPDAGDYIQDQAITCAWIEDPAMLLMNISYEHLPNCTEDYFNILHRAVKFMFEAFPVGVDQILTDEFNLSVFPNPATDHATVRFSMEAGKEVSVKLYSVTGGLIGNVYKGISAGGENVINLDTEEYVSGLYLLELEVDNKISYSKFVLQ